MALTGLEIYKLLPKTNCKECGFPTCLAFAMKLAQKQAELAVPLRLRRGQGGARRGLGAADPAGHHRRGRPRFEVGNETVMFRHEKTFFHPPGLVVRVKTTTPPRLAEVAGRVGDYGVERVGMHLTLDGVAVENASGDAAAFAAAVAAARAAAPGLPLMLMSDDPAAIDAALAGGAAADKPLIYAADRGQLAGAWPRWPRSTAARWRSAPRPATSPRWPSCPSRSPAPAWRTSCSIRARRPSPPIWPRSRSCGGWRSRRRSGARLSRSSPSPARRRRGRRAGARRARRRQVRRRHRRSTTSSPAMLYALLTLRQNIYTDPQKPIQVEPELYEIGDAEPGLPAADHHQLLADLLLRRGRGRGRRRAGLAAGRRRRGPCRC